MYICLTTAEKVVKLTFLLYLIDMLYIYISYLY